MGAQEKSPSNTNSMQRVKVYRLNDDGKWDDQGTGHVTVDYVERTEELGLFVIDEEDNETLLLHRISSEDIYRKQEDTIISWRDPEYSTELALSFQETAGCSYIWDHICNVQRNLQFNTLHNEALQSVDSELKALPAVELSTLPLILKTVVESGIADQMQLTELILNSQDFFRKLMDLFKICEDLENVDGLHMIFKIVKGTILLNSPQIFEKIFADDLMLDIIGSLEYDSEVPSVQHHRNFLKDHVVFKEAIPIKDPLVLSKIHQTYRVGYLKDVILPRVLDEAIIANLNSIIHANNAIVISLLKDDSTFIQELFARLKSSTTSAESKKNLVLFLHEFCSLSKSLQMVQQHRLFRDLMNEGIFDIITDALQSHDKRLVLTGTDIVILFQNQDPNLLRSYVIKEEGIQLFGLLVKGMITDFGEDMNCQFLEILRNLLDSYTLSGAQKDAITEIFYEKHMGQLIDLITSSCPQEGVVQSVSNSAVSEGKVENKKSVKPEILLHVCELLCFCVVHHPYRIKCNFLLNNLIDKVLFLMQRREKYLVVAAVRFIRTLLSRESKKCGNLQDQPLVNHIIKNNLLKPIVDVFIANGHRYNLLNSAILELFEYIRKENMKFLLKYLIDSFWDELVKFEKYIAVRALKIKYDQFLESFEAMKTTANASESRKRNDERALDKEEEDYFNEDSDEEDTASKVQAQSNGGTPSLSGGLVDYDDDEDDEDYRPPRREQLDISDGEDAMMESLKNKRKLELKDKNESDMRKKQRLEKKSKDSVFAALCSTLSQAVLPSKKTEMTPPHQDGKKILDEANHKNKEPAPVPSSDNTKISAEQNHKENEPSPASAPSLASALSSSPTPAPAPTPTPTPTSAPAPADSVIIMGSAEENHTEKEPAPAPPRSCSDRQLSGGEDCPLLPPKSSPEMAVNGS